MDFSVQFGTVDNAVAQLRQIASQMTSIADQLKAQITAGTVDFQGSTADQFQQASQAYDRAHAAVTADVETSAVALQQIGDQYTSNESRWSAAWG